MPRLAQRLSSPSILSQAAGLGLMLYGAVTGTSSMVAVGVIMTGVAATAASRTKKDTAEE